MPSRQAPAYASRCQYLMSGCGSSADTDLDPAPLTFKPSPFYQQKEVLSTIALPGGSRSQGSFLSCQLTEF
jgi:hypothetical protein